MTKTELEQIVKTLPIGYYAKAEVGVSVDEDAETSYYDPTKNAIVISLPIINAALDGYPKGYDMETAVRSMLYHEVSHAILTPKACYSDILNVFEDERIETLLSDFYMNVDFKKQVFAVNQFDGHKPKDGWDYFYQVVRYRIGEQEDLDRVANLIDEYAWVDASRHYCPYVNEIVRFYENCCRKYGNPPENHALSKGYSLNPVFGDGDGSDDDVEQTDGVADGASRDIDGMAQDAKAKVAEGKKAGTIQIDMPSVLKGLSFVDENLTDNFRQIFNSVKSRQLNNGNAMNGYSGVFDPRSVLRDDYKYFIRQSAKGNGKGFSKFNLNLFIDCSGSYNDNVPNTNRIINALATIEKENPMFTFTVTGIGSFEKTLPKENRFIQANGGTYLTDAMYDIYRKVQRADAVNYNIVLYDGGTYGKEYMDVYNHKNLTVISDNDNKRALLNKAPNCKKIFVDPYGKDQRSYAERLYENVMNTLKVAFM